MEDYSPNISQSVKENKARKDPWVIVNKTSVKCPYSSDWQAKGQRNQTRPCMVMFHAEPVHLNSPQNASRGVRPPSSSAEALAIPSRCECRSKVPHRRSDRPFCSPGCFSADLSRLLKKGRVPESPHISTHLEQHPASASLSLTSIVVLIVPPCPLDMPLPCE